MIQAEKRAHPRFPQTATAFIEFYGSGNSQPGLAPIVVCNSLDISREGVRVSIDQFIDTGTILQLGLELPAADAPLYFAAEVCWCRNLGKFEGYQAGFRLLDSDGTDLEQWRVLVEDVLDEIEEPA